MNKVLVALLCTVGVVACGEKRAEDPSTVRTTTVTSETTVAPGTRNAQSARANTQAPTSTTTSPAPAAAPRLMPDAEPSQQPARTDATTGAAVDNPGVAHGTKDADNTKINDRDRHGAATPGDQGGGNDRDITAAIRRAVVGDKALSFNAKNVKIVTEGGKVTLRGPVKSDEEKASIEAKAKATPGVSTVDNQLEVKK